jgi:hypothetical protein
VNLLQCVHMERHRATVCLDRMVNARASDFWVAVRQRDRPPIPFGARKAPSQPHGSSHMTNCLLRYPQALCARANDAGEGHLS